MFERVFNRLGHGSVVEKIEEEEEEDDEEEEEEEEESRLVSVQGERWRFFLVFF